MAFIPCDVAGCPNPARWYYPKPTLFGWNLCDTCKDTDPRGVECRPIEGLNWEFRARRLLAAALDVEDKAVVEGAAMLAAGHGVKFVFTIGNGLMVDVRAERLDEPAQEVFGMPAKVHNHEPHHPCSNACPVGRRR